MRPTSKTLLKAQTFEEKNQASEAVQPHKETTVCNTHIRCGQGEE